MNEKLKTFRENIEQALRRICGRITPDKRIMVIVIALGLLAVLNFYFIGSALYHLGRSDAESKFDFKRITLPVAPQGMHDQIETLNDFNIEEDENENSEQ